MFKTTVPQVKWIALALLLVGPASAGAADYYVSPTGADANPGTSAAPFATVAKARDAIRQSNQAGKQPVTVHLADGTYFLGETLALTARDCGSADAPVTYQADHEGKAVLSGATRLTGLTWTPAAGGVLKTAVPAEVLKGCAFDELWVGRTRLDMARYPNHTEGKLFNGVTSLGVLNERVKGYKHPETAYVHALHGNEWGSVHFRVTGYKDGKLQLEGGWQQNRNRSPNTRNMMIENVFEELDSPGEWFLDRTSGTLYVYPPKGLDLAAAELLATNLRELIRLDGSQSAPVRHVSFRGLVFRNARRIFMEPESAWQALLRGDWSIVRSAAVLMTGTENCTIRDCTFDAVGGNGAFFNNYNRSSAVVDCLFQRLGESAVCFVGNYACTRGNPVGFAGSIPQSKIDLTPGPKGEDFPQACKMQGCLVFASGRVGKQTAGAFISMSRDITVSHNTIYHVPRSGITVNDGCWGGHAIEHNDVFDTVIETGDHGPFNSWGRDRYWDTRSHSNKGYREPISTAGGEKTPQSVSRDRARLDVVKPITLRNNRFMHPWNKHSWGIDLDDGSSNYHVYNNLCLGCTVKLREGFFRRVYNNVLIGRAGVQMHVPFDYNSDYVCNNIVVTARPVTIPWRNDMRKLADAEKIDDNVYWSVEQYADPNAANAQLAKYQAAGIDTHSVSADPKFLDPARYDFRVAADSPAVKLGFKNFPMDDFGVTRPALRAIAAEGHRKYQRFDLADVFGKAAAGQPTEKTDNDKRYTILGSAASDLDTEQEKSVAGVGELAGVFIIEAPKSSAAAKAGIRAGDAILEINGRTVADCKALLDAFAKHKGKTVVLRVVGATDRKVKVKLD